MRMHVALIVIAAALLCGCASTSDSKTQPKTVASPDGTPYKKHGQIQLAWFDDGFDFSGYDTLVIAPTKYTAKERPNEVEMRNWYDLRSGSSNPDLVAKARQQSTRPDFSRELSNRLH